MIILEGAYIKPHTSLSESPEGVRLQPLTLAYEENGSWNAYTAVGTGSIEATQYTTSGTTHCGSMKA